MSKQSLGSVKDNLETVKLRKYQNITKKVLLSVMQIENLFDLIGDFSHDSTFHSWTITGSVCAIWSARGRTPNYPSTFLTSCFCLASFRKFPLIPKSNTRLVFFYLPRSLEKVKQYAYVKNSCLHSSYLLHFAFRIWVPFKWPRT